MRRELEQPSPLVERFPDERELAKLQVPQAPVNQARRIRGRSERQIGRIDEPDRRAVEYQVAGDRRAVDAAAKNQNGPLHRRNILATLERVSDQRSGGFAEIALRNAAANALCPCDSHFVRATRTSPST